MSITVSIVSHGHGEQVTALLRQLAELGNADLRRVIVTQNVAEPDPTGPGRLTSSPFEIVRLVNPRPAGFGANHNRAFAEDARQGASNFFAVVNPDVGLLGDPFPALSRALAGEWAGCAYPVQVDAAGLQRDHERCLPTPLALVRRYLAPGPRTLHEPPDWVNAAFLLFPQAAFARIGGFDTRYHMYCEDVDLCLRLQLAGLKLVRASSARVLHQGRRATRSSGRHLFWHVASLWRLWNSAAYRDFQRLRNPLH